MTWGSLRSRTTTTLGVAVALHLLAALGVRVAPLPESRRAPDAEEPASAAEIAIEAPASPERAAPTAAGGVHAETQAGASALSAGRPDSALAAAIGGREAISGERTSAEGAAPGPGGDAGTWFRATTAAPVDLRLGLGAAAPPPLVRREEDDAEGARKAVLSALDQADTERGFGRGGPVRTAVELAARGSDAPALGTAIFSVAIGTDGSVQVDVQDQSTTGWDALSPAIQQELKSKRIRIPPNSHGLRVTVRVEASEQYPGGGRPPAKSGFKAVAKGPEVIETKDQITITPPYAAAGYQGRKCAVGVVVTPGGIGGGAGCEVGVPMRVVAVRILNEQRL